jgi:nucleotide-binding universal stress UspA family protein
MIQTILFATDLCVFTPYILKHVTDLAQRWGAKVVLVHAVEPLGSLGTAVVNTYLPEKIGKDFNEQGLESLVASIKDRLIELLADEMLSGEEGVQAINDVVVEIGRPDQVVLNWIKLCDADMVVMGSHTPDRNRLPGLGSTATKVMQRSKVPVYLVPVLPDSPAAAGNTSMYLGLG